MQLFNKIIGKLAPKFFATTGHNTQIRGRIERRNPNSKIIIGDECLIAGTLVVEAAKSCINIGNNVFIGGGSLLDCLEAITIGDNVLISYDVIVMDSDNHSTRASIRSGDLERWKHQKYDWSHVDRSPVNICSNAWVGARAIITKGVQIGEGAIVASGAVVTKNVSPYTIVAGNPARVIRKLNENER